MEQSALRTWVWCSYGAVLPRDDHSACGLMMAKHSETTLSGGDVNNTHTFLKSAWHHTLRSAIFVLGCIASFSLYTTFDLGTCTFCKYCHTITTISVHNSYHIWISLSRDDWFTRYCNLKSKLFWISFEPSTRTPYMLEYKVCDMLLIDNAQMSDFENPCMINPLIIFEWACTD